MASYDLINKPLLSESEQNILAPSRRFLRQQELPASTDDMAAMADDITHLLFDLGTAAQPRAEVSDSLAAHDNVETLVSNVAFLGALHDVRFSLGLTFLGALTGTEQAAAHDDQAKRVGRIGRAMVIKRARDEAAGLCLATQILEETTSSHDEVASQSLYVVANKIHQEAISLSTDMLSEDEIGNHILYEAISSNALRNPKGPRRFQRGKIRKRQHPAVMSRVDSLFASCESFVEMRDVPNFSDTDLQTITTTSHRLNDYLLEAASIEPAILQDPRARLLGYMCATAVHTDMGQQLGVFNEIVEATVAHVTS